MNEVVKAAGMYILTSVITAIATRYHLDGNQSTALMTDALAVISGASGVVLHYLAYRTVPPKS